MDKYTTFERLAANKWWVHCNGEPLTTYQVTHLLNELTEENAQLKELINMICEADSYTERSSVKEILRDTIKSIDTAAEYSCDAWNDYCKLSNFFKKQYDEETWDNYE